MIRIFSELVWWHLFSNFLFYFIFWHERSSLTLNTCSCLFFFPKFRRGSWIIRRWVSCFLRLWCYFNHFEDAWILCMFIVASWEIGRISILCRDPAVTYCHYWVVYKTTITVFTLLWARLLWTFILVWGPLPELPEFGFYPAVPKWRKFEENREKLPVFNFDVTKQACMCMCASFCIFIYSYVYLYLLHTYGIYEVGTYM